MLLYPAGDHGSHFNGGMSDFHETAAVRIWSQRCNLAICQRLSEDLSAGNDLCDDQSGNE